MKAYIIGSIVFLTIFTGCARKPYDERLLGSWKSNREQTIKRFISDNPEHVKKLGEEKVKKFESLFGKMVITYDKYKYRIKLDDYTNETEYSIVEKGNDFVIINSKDLLSETTAYIKFENNGYWLTPDKNSKLVERFDKIK